MRVLTRICAAVGGVASFAAAAITILVNWPDFWALYGEGIQGGWLGFLIFFYDHGLVIGMLSALLLGTGLGFAVANQPRRASEPTLADMPYESVPGWMRVFVKVLDREGEAFANGWYWSRDDVRRAYAVDWFCDFEPHGDFVRFTPKPEVAVFCERNGKLLALLPADEEAAKAVYDPGKAKAPDVRCVSGFDWWWYSDEPEVDAKALIERSRPPGDSDLRRAVGLA